VARLVMHGDAIRSCLCRLGTVVPKAPPERDVEDYAGSRTHADDASETIKRGSLGLLERRVTDGYPEKTRSFDASLSANDPQGTVERAHTHPEVVASVSCDWGAAERQNPCDRSSSSQEPQQLVWVANSKEHPKVATRANARRGCCCLVSD